MPADGPNNSWPPAVIAFLKQYLRVERNGAGEFVAWDHAFSTAFQIGCEALVALGQAMETDRGAIPLASPQLPDPLPRWDDVAVAVLWLARQQNRLDYRLADGSLPPPRSGFVIVGRPPPPLPNIQPAHGLGAAWGAPETIDVLEQLGLVDSGAWTSLAETVLWRDQPPEWRLDVTSDARFADAVAGAQVTTPAEIRAEMDRLSVISADDVRVSQERAALWLKEARAKYGPKAKLSAATTAKDVRRGLELARPYELDWIFFRRWRLGDGWLTQEQADRALEVFHDRLAISIRKAVAAAIYPEAAYLAR